MISLWLGLQPPENRPHPSIGMISPIDYELAQAQQADPETEDPGTEVA